MAIVATTAILFKLPTSAEGYFESIVEVSGCNYCDCATPAPVDYIRESFGFAGMVHAESHNDFVTDVDFGIGNFPVMRIYTEIPAIDRNEWITATISISNTDEAFQMFNVHARIRGRGQSSWLYAKRPFRIRFNQPITMLDSGHAARDWTFIANHFDNSLMRNYSAYHMARMMDGMYTAPFARFIDVYFNGEYQGVYMLCIQHSYIAEGQVNLTSDRDPTISEYLLELDARIRTETLFEDFIWVNTRSYEIRYPTGNRLTIEHARYIADFLYNIEVLLMMRDEAVFNYIHIPSFVDFYIVRELYKEADTGTSIFMQIRGQGDERRLEMGPVWDFDRSLGINHSNKNWRNFEYNITCPYGIDFAIGHHWFRFLMEMPTFFNAVTERWNEVKYNQIPQTIAHIRYMAETYQEDFERNFLRWPILGNPSAFQNQEVGQIDTFMGHVEQIIDFLERRTVWLDEYFNSRCCRNPWCGV